MTGLYLSIYWKWKFNLFPLHPDCRKDDLEAGMMLLSQAEKDKVVPNLVMCRCIIG